MVKLAIDMMGGDDAPGIVLEAVEKAVNDYNDLEIILFGDSSQCTLEHERVEIRHCTESIAMDDEPVRAIRRKKIALWLVWLKRLSAVRRMDVFPQVILAH